VGDAGRSKKKQCPLVSTAPERFYFSAAWTCVGGTEIKLDAACRRAFAYACALPKDERRRGGGRCGRGRCASRRQSKCEGRRTRSADAGRTGPEWETRLNSRGSREPVCRGLSRAECVRWCRVASVETDRVEQRRGGGERTSRRWECVGGGGVWLAKSRSGGLSKGI
jgi:hypothetical protein